MENNFRKATRVSVAFSTQGKHVGIHDGSSGCSRLRLSALLIACTNIVALLLSRAARVSKKSPFASLWELLAVALVAQLLTETFLLALSARSLVSRWLPGHPAFFAPSPPNCARRSDSPRRTQLFSIHFLFLCCNFYLRTIFPPFAAPAAAWLAPLRRPADHRCPYEIPCNGSSSASR